MLNLKTVQPEAKQRLDGSVMVKFRAGSGVLQRKAKKKKEKEENQSYSVQHEATAQLHPDVRFQSDSCDSLQHN